MFVELQGKSRASVYFNENLISSFDISNDKTRVGRILSIVLSGINDRFIYAENFYNIDDFCAELVRSKPIE